MRKRTRRSSRLRVTSISGDNSSEIVSAVKVNLENLEAEFKCNTWSFRNEADYRTRILDQLKLREKDISPASMPRILFYYHPRNSLLTQSIRHSLD